MRILSSGGLTFNGDSATANALDDYEEGTWTPELRFGGNNTGMTFHHQTGTYTKIGNRVYVTCYMLVNAKGSSTGTAKIYGLPFTNASSTSGYNHLSMWINTCNFGDMVPTGYVEPNSTRYRIERQRATSNSGVATADETNFLTNTDVMIMGHYLIG